MPRQLDDYRLLGRSGLRVSPLTLGTMGYASNGWGPPDDEAQRQVDLYMDRGGNFIDTANFYNGGGSERVLGKCIASKRHRVVVSTKYSMFTVAGDPNNVGNHRKAMVRGVEDSLQRLGTDYIDLLYLHMWDSRTPPEEILRAFDDLVRQGKILYAGISDSPAWQIARMQGIADLRGWTPFVALQIPYSLAEREVERELIPMARGMGLGVAPWAPLLGGVLTGKYSRSDIKAEGETITKVPETREEINANTGKITLRNIEIAETVGAVAKDLGKTSAQVALAWTMLDHAIVSPVMGPRTVAQLEDNIGSLDVEFDASHFEKLEAISKIELGFPYSMMDGPATSFLFGGVKVEKRR